MAKKKLYKAVKDESKVNEPLAVFKTSRIKIFNSFDEQAAYELKEMATLSSVQILQQLRKFINIAYGMHGYNPDSLPKKHFIKIISG